MNTVQRTVLVHNRLVHGLAHEVGIVAQPMTRFEWLTTDLRDPSNLHRPHGWIPPYEIDEEGDTIVGPFCPGLITEQTRFLIQREFVEYLDTIEFSLYLHITHRRLPWPEREAKVDHELWDIAPGSIEHQNRVLLRILDHLSTAA